MIKKIPGKKNKADLMIALQELLQNKTVGTQEEIRAALEKQGLMINQVKISRLLHKIGAIKISEGEQIVYRLPTEMMTVTPKISLRQLVLSITHNEAMIVIQTAPGSAQLVARLLDLKKQSGVLGTVAGDDTIFVAPEKIKHIQVVYEMIYNLLLN